MWSYNYTNTKNELMHHGIFGQRWGIRRYQNKDGSLTAVGRARQRSGFFTKLKGKKTTDAEETTTTKQTSTTTKPKAKSISEMSNQEIQARIDRIRLENTLKSLQPQKVSAGKQLAMKVANEVLIPTAMDAGKKYLSRALNKALGNDKKDSVEAYMKALRTQEEKERLKYKIHSYQKQMSK